MNSKNVLYAYSKCVNLKMCKKIYKYIYIIHINNNMNNQPTISPMYILLIKK